MSDNVIILGAGFSFDAGIPMLGNFIEKMWEYSLKGPGDETVLFKTQKTILDEALKIRAEMDGYHGRVAFDDRNIEDILSMLAFNTLGGNSSGRNKLLKFEKAISTTIELACNVKYSGLTSSSRITIQNDGHRSYQIFWKNLISWYKISKNCPAIITFNYDLVLERSLLQILNNTFYNRHDPFPFEKLTLDYHFKNFPKIKYDIKYNDYIGYDRDNPGSIISTSKKENDSVAFNIELLKLHGSLNFSKSKIEDDEDLYMSEALDEPLILPPVSNKKSNNTLNESWKVALNKMRAAKNIIFVGYSLPKTDIYMQFFLKAALGPNRELNKIIIFDPTLWSNNSAATEMINRYESCFSEQMRKRIIFKPRHNETWYDIIPGTTQHFIRLLGDSPQEIFF